MPMYRNLPIERASLVVILTLFFAPEATANECATAWREGQSRIVGYGHCAKGHCMRRESFGLKATRHDYGGHCEERSAADDGLADHIRNK